LAQSGTSNPGEGATAIPLLPIHLRCRIPRALHHCKDEAYFDGASCIFSNGVDAERIASFFAPGGGIPSVFAGPLRLSGIARDVWRWCALFRHWRWGFEHNHDRARRPMVTTDMVSSCFMFAASLPSTASDGAFVLEADVLGLSVDFCSASETLRVLLLFFSSHSS